MKQKDCVGLQREITTESLSKDKGNGYDDARKQWFYWLNGEK